LTLLDPATAGDRWAVAGLSALVAAWHFTFRRLGIGEERPWLVAAYLAGLFALWFLLAGIHPAFFSLLLVLYPQVFRHLRLARAIPAAVVLSVAVVWREVLASGRPLSENLGAVVGGLLSVTFGTLLALWITRIIEESYERRQLIEQLEATRSELAAAEREGGRLAERQRLARDIHDTLAQGFVSIVLQLQAAEQRRHRRRPVHQRGDRQDPSAACVRQAGCGRPHRRRGRGPGARDHRAPPPPLRRFDQRCAVAPRSCGHAVETKGSGVTQSDVSASTGGSEATSSPRSSRAERNAATAADLDRSKGSFATAPASTVQLAEIEEVDPGTIFQRDGAGFPDWLSANLDRLAKELGLSGLREVGRDVGVGSFTADLLAQTDRGRRVAIMSHLEPSDHLHLGQMITFAAGLDVSAVVWITTRIGEEHRAVLDWLNQHGDDDVRFFGVELRLLRIGGSQPGASFHVEARPNDWQKVIKQRQRVGSPINSRMREF